MVLTNLFVLGDLSGGVDGDFGGEGVEEFEEGVSGNHLTIIRISE